VLFGTTNNTNFLKDATGNRRFWPVDVGVRTPTKNVWQDLTQAEVDQLWAEAFHLYWNKNEQLYLNPEEEMLALQQQDLHFDMDDRAAQVFEYLETPLPDDWEKMDRDERKYWFSNPSTHEPGTIKRNRVSVNEIWFECFRGDIIGFDKRQARMLHEMMRKMPGWEDIGKQRCLDYGVVKTYGRAEKKKSQKPSITK